MKSLITILSSILISALLLIAAGLIYIYSGAYDVAASDEHTGVTVWIFETMQDRSIRARAQDLAITLPSDTSAIRRAYVAYADMCEVCHGAPGKERGWMGKGMNPQPPDLQQSGEEYGAEEIYWVLRNGIKLAGMPALEPTHTDEEILELTAFVKQLPEMTDEAYASFGAASPDTTDGDHGHEGHSH